MRIAPRISDFSASTSVLLPLDPRNPLQHPVQRRAQFMRDGVRQVMGGAVQRSRSGPAWRGHGFPAGRIHRACARPRQARRQIARRHPVGQRIDPSDPPHHPARGQPASHRRRRQHPRQKPQHPAPQSRQRVIHRLQVTARPAAETRPADSRATTSQRLAIALHFLRRIHRKALARRSPAPRARLSSVPASTRPCRSCSSSISVPPDAAARQSIACAQGDDPALVVKRGEPVQIGAEKGALRLRSGAFPPAGIAAPSPAAPAPPPPPPSPPPAARSRGPSRRSSRGRPASPGIPGAGHGKGAKT